MVEETAYDATQIQVLEGLQAVRRRPAMYIGSVDSRDLHHLVHEGVDNSIDEAMAGFCKEIQVTLNPDGSVTVADDGRGIPVDIHPKYGAPGVEIVLSRMHSGGKFERKMYRVSGGLHGVGLSVVNGLSEWLEVRVKREGQEHRMRFERGTKATDLEVVGPAEGTGTIITFLPDSQVFESIEFDYDILATRLRELAFLSAGLHQVREGQQVSQTGRKPRGRRRPRGIDGDPQPQGPRTAVRGADEDETRELRDQRNRRVHRVREAHRFLLGDSQGR